MNNIVGNNPNLNELKVYNPREWFKRILSEKDFDGLKQLSINTGGRVGWNELILDGVCEIENDRLLGINWIRNLDLSSIVITSLGKVKEVNGNLNLNRSGLGKLGILERVKGNMPVVGLVVELQLEIINKLNSGDLKVDGEVFFGGFIINIEKILEIKKNPGNLLLDGVKSIKELGELEEVGGSLNLECSSVKKLGKLRKVGGDLFLKGTDIELQFEAIEKVNNGTLVIDGKLYLDQIIQKYLDNNKLNYKKFKKDFGKNITKIKDNHLKIVVIGLLNFEYKRIFINNVKKVKNIRNIEELTKLNNRIIKLKERFSSFGLEIEEIDISII